MNNPVTEVLKWGLWILTIAMLSCLSSCTTTKSALHDTPTENLIIYYSPVTGYEELLGAARKYGSKILYVYKNINGIAVTVPKSKTLPEAMKYYEKVNGVLSVVPDRKVQLD